MRELIGESLTQVSGAAYVTAEYEHSSSSSNGSAEVMYISGFPTDGSLPKEFQDRIDAGASWEEMAPWLIMYSIIRETHPEFFQ